MMIRKVCGKAATFYRKRKLKNLQVQYGFHDWHLYSVISKPYIKGIINYITHNGPVSDKGYVVECGCGLCDIIGNRKLKGYKRIGIDASKEVCEAAQALYKDIKLIHGTFDNISNLNIEFLIAVNFVHEISPEDMKGILQNLTTKNNIHYFIVDEVTGNYPYSHNFNKIMPAEYDCKHIMGPYDSDGGKRNVKVFKKRV